MEAGLPVEEEDLGHRAGSMTADELCAEIIRSRDCGVVYCAVLDRSGATPDGIAKEFNLAPASKVNYFDIDASLTFEIAVLVLHRDLAYSTQIMPTDRAKDLAQRFIALFGEPAQFCTNANFLKESPEGYPGSIRLSSWNPATDATFDTGIIVIGKELAGCLWVEDED